MSKTILDLCGGTGAWSKPYLKAGYNVILVDPLRKSPDLSGDVRLLEFLERPIHGILAAPPCTVFSYARNRYPPTDDEFLKGLSVVDACLRAVVLYQPTWWALENPRNKVRRWLGEPKLVFRQWEYGGGAEKPTGIWGDFNIPKKCPVPRTKASTAGTNRPNAVPADAVTPAGFAKAFFEANP